MKRTFASSRDGLEQTEASLAAARAKAAEALREADAVKANAEALRAPQKPLAYLKEAQQHAEGPAGQSFKYSAGMQTVEHRWRNRKFLLGSSHE